MWHQLLTFFSLCLVVDAYLFSSLSFCSLYLGVDVAPVGEIGGIASKAVVGRTSRRDITLFKSVGAAVEGAYALSALLPSTMAQH
jgi:hypothetical protein